ncbi:MAG: hypothetical protein ACI87W_003580, partial [Halieaceae bacterium]
MGIYLLYFISTPVELFGVSYSPTGIKPARITKPPVNSRSGRA